MVLLTASDQGNKMKGVKRKLLLTFSLGIVCLIAAPVLMLIDPVLIMTNIKMKVFDGSPIHEFLKKPLHSIYLAAYLYNLTNPEQFILGEHDKLKIQEIGPFVYLEKRYNEHLELDVEAEVIKYEPRTEIAFVPEMSSADPSQLLVTLPNLPMLGLTSTLSTYPYFTRLGFSLLTSQLHSKPIVTVNATTYLWGYDEPLVALVHKLVPGLINFEKIGILDRLFDKTTKNKLVVGASANDKFMIKTRNGHKKLGKGNKNPDECKICDDFTNSYEGIGYPSGVTEKTTIRLFRNGLCRILDMVYNKTVVMDNGVDGLVFNLSDSFFSWDSSVTRNRILDLTDCFYGLPVGLTKVCFLDMDPEFYERIEGIEQDRKKESYIIIEPKIAMELDTYIAVQINLIVKNTEYIHAAKPFSNMVIPIGYVEITQPELPEETKVILNMMYMIAPKFLIMFEVLFLLSGVALLMYSVLVYIGVSKEGISFPISRTGKANVLNTQKPLLAVKPNHNTSI